jgi:8-amino-7-oxononanoate synthase
MSLDARWRTHLEALHREGRYRQLSAPRGIDFSSNDYLGYAKLAWPATAESRSGAASRLLRGHAQIWDEVEERLARWHGAEAALVLTSGYVTNEGLLATLIEPHDFVASDELNHASIVDGLRLSRAERFVFRHNDLDDVERGLHSAARMRPAARQLFIVTESLFGMEGDRAPLAALAELARRYEAHLIVDEAHATGCFGPAGSGLVDELRLRGDVLATVHTGGKALGVPGAYVVGSRLLKELLINRCRHFIFTTALPPALGSWWLDALDRVEKDEFARAALHTAARHFREMLREHGLVPAGQDYIVPLVLGDDAAAVEAARQMQAAGFDMRAIRPPTVPPGTACLRVSIHADHSFEMLGRAAETLAKILRGAESAHHVA